MLPKRASAAAIAARIATVISSPTWLRSLDTGGGVVLELLRDDRDEVVTEPSVLDVVDWDDGEEVVTELSALVVLDWDGDAICRGSAGYTELESMYARDMPRDQ